MITQGLTNYNKGDYIYILVCECLKVVPIF